MHSESLLSTPNTDQLATWWLFFESAYALQEQAGISLRWVLEQEQDPGVDAGLGRVGQGTESPPRSPRFRRGPAVRLHPTRGA